MRVLLAEDDAQIGEGVVHGLRKAGFAVDWVRNGSEADTALNGDGFDDIIFGVYKENGYNGAGAVLFGNDFNGMAGTMGTAGNDTGQEGDALRLALAEAVGVGEVTDIILRGPQAIEGAGPRM